MLLLTILLAVVAIIGVFLGIPIIVALASIGLGIAYSWIAGVAGILVAVGMVAYTYIAEERED